ncbi:MAG: HEAT repeat domain-containing protein [Pirellulaceae bacterium]|jgi:hypothetical protein|nr:HEAT repeat domain-containing protein [Pirellulaceae bacterium]MDP7018481.1 HEAT repeat domain-containing protein [Pirellulaceae bacterium]
MSSSSETPQSTPKTVSPDDSLPPVQAPSSGFILQLFLIPLIIVSIIVAVWLMFSWLAQMGNDPEKMVREIRTMNTASWQKALTLANMLQNPEYAELKDDEKLATDLAAILQEQLKQGDEQDKSIQLRRYLCRAVGEFKTTATLPALTQAVRQEKSAADVVVRRSALAAVAVMAGNVGPEKLRNESELFDAVIEASRERGGAPEDDIVRADIRSTAAFTLGVLGGQVARDRLADMIDDAHAETRYNAGTGLARHGDERAIPVLLEMLDPNNEYAIEGELSESAELRKRISVMSNGVRAAAKFMKQNKTANVSELQQAIQNIADAKVHGGLRTKAMEALNEATK